MQRIIHYTVKAQDSGLTILAFLRKNGFSKHILTTMKRAEHAILLNGLPAFGRTILKEQDVLKILVPEEVGPEESIIPVKIPLDILYEDEDILVLNKPADMPVHPSAGNYENTLANGVAWYYKQQGKTFVYRCINRLDRDTSGLTIVAKHYVSAGMLSAMIANKATSGITREYLAIAKGSVRPLEGTITAPLGRKEGSIIERTVDFENGESAVTHYRVLDEKNGHSLVSLILETGRTHQIRIHMKYLGYPLIGDYLYNPDMEQIQRQALHAWKLSFVHPITGEKMQFTAPLPEDMAAVLYP